jgi:hypothetical protein
MLPALLFSLPLLLLLLQTAWPCEQAHQKRSAGPGLVRLTFFARLRFSFSSAAAAASRSFLLLLRVTPESMLTSQQRQIAGRAATCGG